MKGFVGITAQLAFIFYVLITFPEYDLNDIEYSYAYQHFAFVCAAIQLVYAFEYFAIEGPKGLLYANVLVSTSVIYWLLLDLIQGRYTLDGVTSNAVKMSFVCISIFSISVQISSNYTFRMPEIIENASKLSVSAGTIFKTVLACFTISIFFFYKASYFDFAHMMRGLSKSRFASPWARGSAGGLDAVFEHLKYFGYMLPPLTGLLFMMNRLLDPRNIAALLLTIGFSAFEFQGGGRRITGFLAGSFIMTMLIYARNRLRFIHFIMVGVGGLGLLLLLDMQLAFRNSGYTGMFEKYEIETLDEVRVDDNFLRLAQIIDMIPSEYPHSGLEYITWSFSRPIPRAIWPNKPLGPGFDVAKMVGAQGVSLTSTVVGESYASYGILMIIAMGTFFGVLSGSLSKLLSQKIGVLGVALYAIGTLALVGGVRSLPDLIIFSYAFLAVLGVYKFVLSKREPTQ